MNKKQELVSIHRKACAEINVPEGATVIVKHAEGFLFDCDGEFVPVEKLEDLLPVAIVEMKK